MSFLLFSLVSQFFCQLGYPFFLFVFFTSFTYFAYILSPPLSGRIASSLCACVFIRQQGPSFATGVFSLTCCCYFACCCAIHHALAFCFSHLSPHFGSHPSSSLFLTKIISLPCHHHQLHHQLACVHHRRETVVPLAQSMQPVKPTSSSFTTFTTTSLIPITTTL